MIETATQVNVTALDAHLALNDKEREILYLLLKKVDAWRAKNGLPSMIVNVPPKESEQANDD
ncbi:hypothetical protein ONR73_04270 [Aeromonas veronii]|uniref:hypothetical protein n=1 Tax=Aeromonas veronii TaxID=654 RepID=UPI0022328C08|nr:hypothetical protein [Aeromonas veronii]UZE60460.1 hypothetical protein ONR73_04270 [Aeromonas veronii]